MGHISKQDRVDKNQIYLVVWPNVGKLSLWALFSHLKKEKLITFWKKYSKNWYLSMGKLFQLFYTCAEIYIIV